MSDHHNRWDFDDTWGGGASAAEAQVAAALKTRAPKLDFSGLGRSLSALPESISQLEWLEELSLSGTHVSDISSLASLPNLVKLEADGARISDVSPLCGKQRLTHLNLNENEVASIAPLCDLTALVSLRLNGNPLRDLSPLARCIALDRLDLMGTQVSDLAPIASASKLRWLDLDRTKVGDVTALQPLRTLEALWLNGTAVADLHAIGRMTSLIKLGLNRTKITDFSDLSRLTSLVVLWLDQTLITDLGPLARLRNLTRLSLKDTKVTDLRPIKDLSELRQLDLGNTPVEDIRPLAGLVRLRGLNLDRTKVESLAPTSNLTAMCDAVVEPKSGTDDGLRYDRTPALSRKPFGQLGRLNEPARTVETVNYLRRLQALELYYPSNYEPFLAIPSDGSDELHDDRRDAAALEQRPASFSFAFQNGRFEAQPQVGSVPQPQVAEDIRRDLRAKVEQALVRLGNAPERVRQSVQRLLISLGVSLDDVAPGILLMRARSLDADIAAFDTPEGRGELLPDALAILKDLGASVDDLKACFPQIAEIEASRIAQGLLENGVEAALKDMKSIRDAAQKSIAVGTSAIGALRSGEIEVAHADEVLANKMSSDAARSAAVRRRANVVGQQLLDYRNFVAGVLHFAGTELSELGASTWKEAKKEVPSAIGKAAGEIASSGLKVTVAALVSALVHPIAGLAMLLGSFRPLSEKAKAIDRAVEKKGEPEPSLDRTTHI